MLWQFCKDHVAGVTHDAMGENSACEPSENYT